MGCSDTADRNAGRGIRCDRCSIAKFPYTLSRNPSTRYTLDQVARTLYRGVRPEAWEEEARVQALLCGVGKAATAKACGY